MTDPAFAQAERDRRRGRPRTGTYKFGYHLRAAYGITVAERDAMAEAQDHRCAICKRQPTRLYLDHDHVTGQVRALLCLQCNVLLGYAHDDPAVLTAAITYLERYHR